MADHQWTPRQSSDGASFPQPFVEIAERSQHLVNEWLNRNALDNLRAATTGSLNMATLFIELASQIMTFPATVVSAQMSLWQDYFSLWQSTTSRMLGREVTEQGPGSAEATHEEVWQDGDIFSYVKQSYLLAARSIREIGGNGASAMVARDLMDFYTRQFVRALSATDFALSNPEMIRATIEMRGENLITGLNNLLRELEAAIGVRGRGRPPLRYRPDAGGDPGQGHLPQRTHGAYPIPADE